MPLPPDRFDQIDRYLRGQMPDAESRAFEAELSADAALAAEVRKQQLEFEALDLLVAHDLRARIKAWKNPTKAPTLKVAYSMRWIEFARVAAVLVLAVAGWWVFWQFSRPDPVAQQLPAPSEKPVGPKGTPPKTETRPVTPKLRPKETQPTARETPKGQPAPAGADDRPLNNLPQKPEPPPPQVPATPPDYAAMARQYFRESGLTQTPMSSPGLTPGDASYGDALHDMQGGELGQATDKLRRTLRTQPNDLKTKELLALTLYQRGQYTLAETHLRQLATSGNKLYAERADWALALVYLNQMPGKKEILQRQLAKITQEKGHRYKGLAERLTRAIQ